ncbi:DEAD/DEAH box helicase [Granulicatella sp. zg-ZJ]|uniref:DEAD/DEAH box helicase n=1 Tax=unclassified Granulicatella TaxID=2630493 RepID=UPI0013C1E9B0|nr:MULTISPECIES: DEAD/DEAH box helicase [unclassified Granulicatella]MBS4749498.1 DEAD/DEAH box helicase [Carnobacteriaceae bacterium zg-ZUI78]NEW62221.1 DEAD/DEAH box helicase [Granulicatella sp. zg-ZJ]NEW66023.1 DEAD/DEAH box helicase [Granulicatella sp. zg-84]QMI86556.1 DEAD/DEAH box helicase [Carnobacteriaceae bacterium zg-84]
MKFSELGLSDILLKSIKNMGFEEATPIQEQTIPLALSGADVIGQAQTGTGKTASFGLPMLEKIDTSHRVIQGLVIAPTRELAIQTQEELFRLSKDKRVRVNVVYGGSDIGRQIKQLKDVPHILVGTPGRLLDHIKRKTISLSHIETLVLDEADEMLNMGFLEDIESIIQLTPETRQTLLFSATMPEAIKRIGVTFMKSPEHVRIKTKEMTANLIDQYFVKCKENEKFDIMTRLFDVQSPELTIIFGRTKRRVDELASGLEARGYKAEGIHGDLSQQKRMSVLRAFKSGKLDILVATDVAARGLDISGVTHVYNYDVPQDPESYVHRIGRTGRAGKEGMSVTLVTPHEMDYLRTIEDLTRKRMTPLRPPTSQEAFEGQLRVALDQVDQMISDVELSDFESAVNVLLSKYTPTELATVLMKTLARDKEEIPVNITPEKPLPMRKRQTRRDGGNRRYNDRNHEKGGNRRYRDRRDDKGGSRYNDRKQDRTDRYDRKSKDGRRDKGFTIRKK